MRRITKRPWFRPKQIGWGLRPVTWQAWAVILAFIAVVIVARAGMQGNAEFAEAMAFLVVAFFAVTVLTGGRPGRP